MAQPDIFLSYNREDAEVARRFAQGFEAAGFDVWWDQALHSGEAYDEVTEAALRNARAVVVLWSKRAVVSRWVRAEASIADENGTLAPVKIEPCELPVMFRLTQTAELGAWRGDARDAGWRAFLKDVQRMIDAGKAPDAAAPAPSSPAAPRSGSRRRRAGIAILPFINRSGEAEDDNFADCMVEDLTAALSMDRRLKVVAASATMVYRKAARDLRQIGQELDVRYLLEGNVRRLGDKLRLTAQLVEAEKVDILWTRKFDRPLAELDDLQEDLVAEVAAHLGVQVERAELDHVLRKQGEVSVREAIMRSDALNMGRPTPARIQASVAEARRAVAIAPDYAPAYAALAGAMSTQLFGVFGYDNPELEREILDNIAKAQALDPSNPLVLCRIASALSAVGQNEEALLVAERAVRGNPNIDIVRATLASVLLHLWRWEEALAECDAVERIAPDGIWSSGNSFSRALANFQAGRLDEAHEYIEHMRQYSNLYPWQFVRILCLAKLGRSSDATAAMRHLRSSWPEMTRSFAETYVRRNRCLAQTPDTIEANAAVINDLWDATEPKA